MIVYELFCKKCNAIIDNNIDEATFIKNLIEAERFICSSCGNSFVPEDDNFRGVKKE